MTLDNKTRPFPLVLLTIMQGARPYSYGRMPHTILTSDRASENFGTRLKSRRESFGLSVSDVSELTHISKDYITAIERLDDTDLPAIGYTLGYVRTYAKALGMDGDVAVLEYKSDVAMTKLPLRDAPHVILRRQWRLPRGFISAVTVASAALMIGVWYGTHSEAVATPTPVIDIAPQYTALQPATPEMTAGLYTLRASAPTWIEVRNVQGTVEVSRIFVTGETWQGSKDGGFSVSIRDAGAVSLFDGQKSIGALGEAGEYLAGLSLAAAAYGPILMSDELSGEPIADISHEAALPEE